MLRLALTVGTVLLATACAQEREPSVRTKIVTVPTVRKCVTTIKPEDVCKTPKACPQITTCGEAYYRFTTCGEWLRDGGVAGERNGIPCQQMCGPDAKTMADRISARPFSPPMRTETTCTEEQDRKA